MRRPTALLVVLAQLQLQLCVAVPPGAATVCFEECFEVAAGTVHFTEGHWRGGLPVHLSGSLVKLDLCAVECDPRQHEGVIILTPARCDLVRTLRRCHSCGCAAVIEQANVASWTARLNIPGLAVHHSAITSNKSISLPPFVDFAPTAGIKERLAGSKRGTCTVDIRAEGMELSLYAFPSYMRYTMSSLPTTNVQAIAGTRHGVQVRGF